jgi:hypothetical protein
MGNWNINISGTGPHHNQNPQCDVDLIAREVVSKLIAGGHTVTSAKLHHGAVEEFHPRMTPIEAPEETIERTDDGA